MEGDAVTTKKLFLEGLRTKGTVYHAAKLAGIARMTAYRWRKDDEAFRAAWNDAHEDAVDEVETSLFERALAGDTTCAIFYLKGNRANYRDRLTLDVNKLDADIERELALIAAGSESTAVGEVEGSESIN